MTERKTALGKLREVKIIGSKDLSTLGKRRYER
jgi:hypothetical protein